jgi:hypothetical protein
MNIQLPLRIEFASNGAIVRDDTDKVVVCEFNADDLRGTLSQMSPLATEIGTRITATLLHCLSDLQITQYKVTINIEPIE